MKRTASISLALAVIVSACSKDKKEEPKDTTMNIIDTYKEEARNTRDENHPDAKVIKQLIDAGADLTKPHKPDFQFDFKDVEDAKAVAVILQDKDFASKIYAPQEGFPTYELISEKEMIIDFQTMADLTDYLKSLAVKNNGEMTGWGTSIEE